VEREPRQARERVELARLVLDVDGQPERDRAPRAGDGVLAVGGGRRREPEAIPARPVAEAPREDAAAPADDERGDARLAAVVRVARGRRGLRGLAARGREDRRGADGRRPELGLLRVLVEVRGHLRAEERAAARVRVLQRLRGRGLVRVARGEGRDDGVAGAVARQGVGARGERRAEHGRAAVARRRVREGDVDARRARRGRDAPEQAVDEGRRQIGRDEHDAVDAVRDAVRVVPAARELERRAREAAARDDRDAPVRAHRQALEGLGEGPPHVPAERARVRRLGLERRGPAAAPAALAAPLLLLRLPPRLAVGRRRRRRRRVDAGLAVGQRRRRRRRVDAAPERRQVEDDDRGRGRRLAVAEAERARRGRVRRGAREAVALGALRAVVEHDDGPGKPLHPGRRELPPLVVGEEERREGDAERELEELESEF